MVLERLNYHEIKSFDEALKQKWTSSFREQLNEGSIGSDSIKLN